MTEKEFAKKIDAKLVKNSGRGMRKADMVKGRYIIDLKEISKSYTINEQIWRKISADAASYGWDKIPVIVLQFKDGPTLALMNYDDVEWDYDD